MHGKKDLVLLGHFQESFPKQLPVTWGVQVSDRAMQVERRKAFQCTEWYHTKLVRHDPSVYPELQLKAWSEVRLEGGRAARAPQDSASPGMLTPLPHSEGPQAGQEFKYFLMFTQKHDHYIRFIFRFTYD